MQDDSQDRVTLSIDEARTLAQSALRRLGFNANEASIVADHVVDAALCGYEYSGLPKLLNIAEHDRMHQPRRPIETLHETPVSARLDGGNTNGMLAMVHATDVAIAKARRAWLRRRRHQQHLDERPQRVLRRADRPRGADRLAHGQLAAAGRAAGCCTRRDRHEPDRVRLSVTKPSRW